MVIVSGLLAAKQDHSRPRVNGFFSSVQFSFIYFTLGYSIYIVYVTNRNKITNKRRKRKKLMVLVEVCGGQRSLIAFELTTATL